MKANITKEISNKKMLGKFNIAGLSAEKNDEEQETMVPDSKIPNGDQAMIDTIMLSVNAGFEQVEKNIAQI